MYDLETAVMIDLLNTTVSTKGRVLLPTSHIFNLAASAQNELVQKPRVLWPSLPS
jgi:hypothetical protein